MRKSAIFWKAKRHYRTPEWEMTIWLGFSVHLGTLNLLVQGRDRVITAMYDVVKTFQTKLHLLESQKQQSNLATFHATTLSQTTFTTAVFPNSHFADKLSTHCMEFADFILSYLVTHSQLILTVHQWTSQWIFTETMPQHIGCPYAVHVWEHIPVWTALLYNEDKQHNSHDTCDSKTT